MSVAILVVGAGQAGLTIARTLREHGHEGSVTLVGAEQHLPYQRPPLSKAFLAGTAGAEVLPLCEPAECEEQGILLLRSQRVVDIDLPRATAITDTGRELGFDRLALATGSRARRLVVPGATASGVFHLRNLEDAQALRAALPQASSVVVVGGGFLGLEAAAALTEAGKRVTVVEPADRLMARVASPVVSAFFLAAHRRRGTSVLLGRSVESVQEAGGAVQAVLLDDGTRLAADLMVVGIGVTPRVEVAEQAGLALHAGGIRVDELTRTSDPSVVAAGDCTVLPAPFPPHSLVRLESVQNAVDQARSAAATLVGLDLPYRALPWFWSEQHGLRLQMAGLSQGHEEAVVRGDPGDESFSVLYLTGGRLVALDSVNRTPDYMAARRALSAGPAGIDVARARDVTIPLRESLSA